MANCYISVLKSFASGDVSEWFKGFGICSRASELPSSNEDHPQSKLAPISRSG